MKKSTKNNHFEDIMQDYMTWEFLNEKKKQKELKESLKEHIENSLKEKKNTLIIQNDWAYFSFINDYLNSKNIKAKVNVHLRYIELENSSSFIFVKHDSELMYNQGACEYHCVIVSEEMTDYERDYYLRRARLKKEIKL